MLECASASRTAVGGERGYTPFRRGGTFAPSEGTSSQNQDDPLLTLFRLLRSRILPQRHLAVVLRRGTVHFRVSDSRVVEHFRHPKTAVDQAPPALLVVLLQELNNRRLASFTRRFQRGLTRLSFPLHIGSSRAQGLDHRQIPFHRRQVKRRPTSRVGFVQVGLRGDVLLNGLEISLLHGLMQRDRRCGLPASYPAEARDPAESRPN